MKFSGRSMLAGILFAFACNNNATEPSEQEAPKNDSVALAADTAIAAQPFFPVSSFLKGEFQYVDSLPVGIIKYRTLGSRTDSGYIKSDEFHRLAAEFLPPEINDSVISQNYTESSFMDRSTNTATFFYKAVNTSIPIQRIDVVTAKGDVYDEVRSLYMEKRELINGRPVSKRMMLKPKRNFQIITINTGDSPSGNTEIVKVVWDNRE